MYKGEIERLSKELSQSYQSADGDAGPLMENLSNENSRLEMKVKVGVCVRVCARVYYSARVEPLDMIRDFRWWLRRLVRGRLALRKHRCLPSRT